MAEIALQGITKNWGASQAVKGIDFQVKSGSLWCCSARPAAASRPRCA
jgi:ABC-type sugar transport system ATPase subunit